MSGVSTPSLRLSRTMTRTVPPSRRNARSCSSAQICALDRHTSSRTDLREQPSVRTKRRVRRYLPVPRVADHRPLAVVDLAFFAGRRRDDDARLGRRAAAQRHDEATDTRVPRGKAVVVDEVLPDGHGVAATRQRLGDQLAIRLAGARARRAARRWRTPGVGGHLRAVMAGFDGPRSVDTSVGNGRFCFRFAAAGRGRAPRSRRLSDSR